MRKCILRDVSQGGCIRGRKIVFLLSCISRHITMREQSQVNPLLWKMETMSFIHWALFGGTAVSFIYFFFYMQYISQKTVTQREHKDKLQTFFCYLWALIWCFELFMTSLKYLHYLWNRPLCTSMAHILMLSPAYHFFNVWNFTHNMHVNGRHVQDT